MVVSIKDFSKKLEALCTSHKQVNSYYHGDLVEILKGKDITYTTVISTSISASILPTEVLTSFQLMVLDKMLSDKENYLDVESNTLLVLSDLINYIQGNDDLFKYCRISGTPNAVKIEDKAFDVVDGWQVTIQVRLMKENGTCLMPVQFPSVVCPDATYDIKDTDENVLYSGSVVAGGNLDQEIQNSTVNVRKSDNTLINSVSVLAEGTANELIADSPITVNSNAFANVKATDSLDVPVKYENGTPVGNIVGGVVQIPNPEERPTALIPTQHYEFYCDRSKNTENQRKVFDAGNLGEKLDIINPALANKPTASSIGGKISFEHNGLNNYLYKYVNNFMRSMPTWMITIVVKHITGANIYFSSYNESNTNSEGFYIQYTAGGNLIFVAHDSSGSSIVPINQAVALTNGSDYNFTFAYDGTNVKLFNQTTQIFTAVDSNPILRPTTTNNIATSALIKPSAGNVFGKSNTGYIGVDEFDLTRLNANVATLKAEFPI